MPRANPRSFCTKWVQQSDAMSDEEHAEADAAFDAVAEKYRNETEAEWKARAKARDNAAIDRYWNDVKPFSLFKS